MPRHFTVEDANRTLPLVRRIAADVVEDYRVWKEALFRYELSAAGERADTGESEATLQLRRAVDEVAERINGYIAELEQVGCVLKGFEEGLVDFPGTLDGRDVYLCWKLGEPEVAYWHAVDSGFQGRQSLESVGATNSEDA